MHGSGAPLWSSPHLLVDSVLRCDGAFKGRIFSPASGNIAQIPLPDLGLTQTGSASQGLDRHFVQALALLPGHVAKSGIEIVRYIANRVLHADIVGIAGISCKHTIWPASSPRPIGPENRVPLVPILGPGIPVSRRPATASPARRAPAASQSRMASAPALHPPMPEVRTRET